MSATKTERCMDIFKYNTSPSEKQIQDIMVDVDCSRAVAYEGLKRVRDNNNKNTPSPPPPPPHTPPSFSSKKKSKYLEYSNP